MKDHYLSRWESNYVIYKFTFIDMNRHTTSLIHIHQTSMIINQTMNELFDIRSAQNHILDEDVMSVPMRPFSNTQYMCLALKHGMHSFHAFQSYKTFIIVFCVYWSFVQYMHWQY